MNTPAFRARFGMFAIAAFFVFAALLAPQQSAAKASNPAPAAPALPPPACFNDAVALQSQGRPLEARKAMTTALFGGTLSKENESQAVSMLGRIAGETILSGKVAEGDPLAFSYTFRKGDTLAGVIRQLHLGVTPAFIERINGIEAAKIGEGTTVKLVRGPFHARISKHSFAIDLYLRSGSDAVFVKRFRVGHGRNGATPLGSFRVAGKAVHATWTPPQSMSSKYKGPVHWGQKHYPLGKEGYFISLQGIGESRGIKGYGIHGTNAPASVGKALSHGCIRVGDADISEIFQMLQEGMSTVEIVP
jgi:hypothetical protein